MYWLSKKQARTQLSSTNRLAIWDFYANLFLMSDIYPEELVVHRNSGSSQITGERLLLLTMVVLAIQDLNLEPHFKGLRKYFTITKKPKRDIESMISAFQYLFKDGDDYFLSFENFCYVFNIEITMFRNQIISYLRKDHGLAYTEYVIWQEKSE